MKKTTYIFQLCPGDSCNGKVKCKNRGKSVIIESQYDIMIFYLFKSYLSYFKIDLFRSDF